jgi:cytidyltransferase-like protein
MPKLITGYLPGVYDLFHIGHQLLFKNASKYCDKLIIGVHADTFVEQYKRKPIQDEDTRKSQIEKYFADSLTVKCVIVGNSHLQTILENCVNIIFHGSDWEIESYKKQIRYYEDDLDKIGIEIKILQYTLGISTTDIINLNYDSFKNITEVLFDLDNTLLLNGKSTYMAAECVQLLQSRNIQVKVITNNNHHTPKEISDSLILNNIPIKKEHVISSLYQAVRYLLTLTEPHKIYVWGSESAKDYIRNHNIVIEPTITDCDMIIILYNNSFTYNNLVELMTKIKEDGVSYIVGNVDILYPDNKLVLPDTGSVYQMILTTTKKYPAFICGKANCSDLTSNIYTPANPHSCIMVGDNILTDGEYAKNVNIPFIHIIDSTSQIKRNINYFPITNLSVLMEYFKA